MKREIKTTLALDGEKAFKQGMEAASRQMRVLASEMKANEAAFKDNAGSLDALTSRGKIFERQVAQQKEIVAALSRAVQESAHKYGEADAKTDGYRIKLNNATAALAKMESELHQNSKAISEFGQDTDKAASKMDKLKEKAQQMADGMKNAGDKLSGIGQKMSLGVTAPIVAGFGLVTQGTKELRGDLAKLQTNAKVASQDMGILDDAMAKLQAVTGETDSNVEGLSELLSTGFRDDKLSELLNSLYGASIKFSDTLKFEGISDGLQETLATGAAVGPFGELLERSGVVLDNFNAGLTEAIANGTQEQYVLDVLAKTGLAQTYEAFRKNNEKMVEAEEANFRLQQSMAKLGATLEPILTPFIEGLTNLINKFNEMDPAAQKTILTIAGIAAAIGPLLVVIGGALTTFASLTTAASVAGVGIGSLVAPIAIAVAAIAGLVAGGVWLIKHWDEVEAKAAALKDDVSNKFNEIENTITEKINAAKEAVGNAIERIKGFFNFEWSLPHLKMPHFNITGEFSLNPPSVPKLGVDWYKTGGIFTSPSIIGVGEAGAEAVLPLDKLEQLLGHYTRPTKLKLEPIEIRNTISMDVNITGEGAQYLSEERVARAAEQLMIERAAQDSRRYPSVPKVIPFS